MVGLVLLVGIANGQAAKDKDKKDVAGAVTFGVYTDKGGEFRFRLKEGDELFASSGKGYKEKKDLLKVIETIKKETAKAKVDDVSGKGKK